MNKIKTIRTVSSYLNWIKENIQQSDFSSFVCYRGHGNKNWKLESSLQRNNLVISEGKLLRTLPIISPEEFPDSLSSFDYLAKAQHYGLPTRLIDFTLNPLIALYFACINEPNRNGKIIAYVGKNKSENKSTIEEVCSYWKYEDELYDRPLSSLPFYSADQLNKSQHHVWEITDLSLDELFAIPKYITPRERNQQAVFLVCIPEIEKKDRTKLKLNEYNDFMIGPDHHPELLDDFYFASDSLKEINIGRYNYITVEVAAKSKQSILQELDKYGISKSFLFPELENQIIDMVKHIDKY